MPGLAYAAAVSLPTAVAPSNSVTVLPASAVPVNVGVVTLVLLSVVEAPESLTAVMSGTDGAAGAMLSIVMLKADEADETFPAGSVAVAVTPWAPCVSVLVAM